MKQLSFMFIYDHSFLTTCCIYQILVCLWITVKPLYFFSSLYPLVCSFFFNFFVLAGPVHAQTHKGSTMIGTGLTPEGIEQNDIVYELMNEMGWRSEAVDIPSWVKEYSYRRYGGTTNFSLNAWKLLTQSVYNCSDEHPDHVRSVIVNRPSLDMRFNLWYKPEDVWSAWDAMILTAETFNSVEPFRWYCINFCLDHLHSGLDVCSSATVHTTSTWIYQESNLLMLMWNKVRIHFICLFTSTKIQ